MQFSELYIGGETFVLGYSGSIIFIYALIMPRSVGGELVGVAAEEEFKVGRCDKPLLPQSSAPLHKENVPWIFPGRDAPPDIFLE